MQTEYTTGIDFEDFYVKKKKKIIEFEYFRADIVLHLHRANRKYAYVKTQPT